MVEIPVIYKPAAICVFQEAMAYHNAIERTLAERLEVAVESTVREIVAYPDRYPVVLGQTRQAIVPIFPYSIFFCRRATAIVIIAIYHHSRKPFGWRRR